MTQAARQFLQELLAKSAATGKTGFDPFELLGTPESVLDELEHSGFITRSKTIRRKIILTDLALRGETEPQTASSDKLDHERRKPHSTHPAQEDDDTGKKTLHVTIVGVIVSAVVGLLSILVSVILWYLSQPRP